MNEWRAAVKVSHALAYAGVLLYVGVMVAAALYKERAHRRLVVASDAILSQLDEATTDA